MSEQLPPQGGDVWQLGSESRWITADDKGFCWWNGPVAVHFGTVDQAGPWFRDASLVFRDGKSVPAPQPDAGETIIRECVVYQGRLDVLCVEDLKGEPLKRWMERHAVRVLATIPVVVPQSLLSVPVLDAVTVTP